MSLQDSRQISDVKVMLKKGADGEGIESIAKTGTTGLVDTYTITFTGGSKTTFTVTNGKGISSISKTSTSGLVDTYTITYNDGDMDTFNVTNGADGVGITSIEKTSTSGLVDTYTITLTNGDTYDFTVTNGVGGGMQAKIIVNTSAGSTVNVTDPSGTSLTVTQVTGSTTQWQCDTLEYGTHTITCSLNGNTATQTVTVDTCKVYEVTVSYFSATITVNYPDNMRGVTFTIVNGETTFTETAPSNANSFTVDIPSAGTWTVTGAYSKDVVISASGEVQTVTFVALKTFAIATDEEIAGMVSEADAGYIDLSDDCGWEVGQEHSVSLTAINASGTYDGVSWTVGESQSAQTVTFVLMHKGLYELVSPVLDTSKQTRNTCSFVVGVKNCLGTIGYMNSTDTNMGSWDGCARRNWCNGGFREAIPSVLRSAFKQFKTITVQTYNGSTLQTSNDYFALVADKEVRGLSDQANVTETSALTQFTYYETASNRIKKVNDTAAIWYERSPRQASQYDFLGVGTNGSSYEWGGANNAWGLAPFGCL